MRKSILTAAIFFVCSLAAAQQKVPSAQLIDKLYPGNASEIEKRLATSSTLTSTPRATVRPTTNSLVLRFRRTPKADRPTTSSSVRTTTTRSRVPVPVDALNKFSAKSADRPTTTGTRTPVPYANTPADLQTYLNSLAKPVAASTPGAHKQVPPVALPVQIPAVVNVNRASEAELMRVLKVDALRAHMIVEFRNTQRQIRDAEDLAQVNGLTQDMILKWQKDGVLKFD